MGPRIQACRNDAMSFKCCHAATHHKAYQGIHRQNAQALNIHAAQLAPRQLQSS